MESQFQMILSSLQPVTLIESKFMMMNNTFCDVMILI